VEGNVVTTVWVLVIGASWAITGYPTREACTKAAQDVVVIAAAYCVPMPAEGTVVGGKR